MLRANLNAGSYNSWGQDGDHPVKDSTVTIEFHDRGGATEVILIHEGINEERERTGHMSGWTAIMDKLAAKYPGSAT